MAGNKALSLPILSLKKLRKEVASEEGEEILGNVLGILRESKESRADFKKKLL